LKTTAQNAKLVLAELITLTQFKRKSQLPGKETKFSILMPYVGTEIKLLVF